MIDLFLALYSVLGNPAAAEQQQKLDALLGATIIIAVVAFLKIVIDMVVALILKNKDVVVEVRKESYKIKKEKVSSIYRRLEKVRKRLFFTENDGNILEVKKIQKKIHESYLDIDDSCLDLLNSICDNIILRITNGATGNNDKEYVKLRKKLKKEYCKE